MRIQSARFVSTGACALLVLSAAACSKPVPKETWIQQSEVKITNGDFKGCVGTAMAKIDSLRVDKGNAIPDLVVAKTKLKDTLEELSVEVMKTEQGTAQIRFIGSGKREPDESRRAISPVLKMLGDEITASCDTPTAP